MECHRTDARLDFFYHDSVPVRRAARFPSTVNIGRHRFGEGEYPYFVEPFPEAFAELQAKWASPCQDPAA